MKVKEPTRNRTVAYNYILEKMCGTQKDLEANVDDSLIKEFRLVGFIKQGFDGDWNARWQVTTFGERQIRDYLEFEMFVDSI